MAVKAYSGDYGWEDARIKCAQDGDDVKGELPAPLSSIENEWIVDLAKGYGLGQFWLGVNDKEVRDEYNNLDGSPHTYFNWANNEPSTGWRAHDCVYTGGNYGYTWDDTTCGAKKDTLCIHVVG